jgi:hypothetical protein
MSQHSSALGTSQWSSSFITECQLCVSTFICHLSHVVQVCFLLLASPSLRKLGTAAGAVASLATREHWGGRDALSSVFSPCDVRGLSRSEQVAVVLYLSILLQKYCPFNSVVAAPFACRHFNVFQMIIDRQFAVGGGGGGSWGAPRGAGGENETPQQIASDIVREIISKSLGQHAAADDAHAFYSSLQSSSPPARFVDKNHASERQEEGEFDALLSASDRRFIMNP